MVDDEHRLAGQVAGILDGLDFGLGLDGGLPGGGLGVRGRRVARTHRDDQTLAGEDEVGIGQAIGLHNGVDGGAVARGNAQQTVAALDDVDDLFAGGGSGLHGGHRRVSRPDHGGQHGDRRRGRGRKDGLGRRRVARGQHLRIGTTHLHDPCDQQDNGQTHQRIDDYDKCELSTVHAARLSS